MRTMRNDADLLEECGFRRGVRGKYGKRYVEGMNVALIAPDVAEYFPDEKAVNESLRSLVSIIKRRRRTRRRAV